MFYIVDDQPVSDGGGQQQVVDDNVNVGQVQPKWLIQTSIWPTTDEWLPVNPKTGKSINSTKVKRPKKGKLWCDLGYEHPFPPSKRPLENPTLASTSLNGLWMSETIHPEPAVVYEESPRGE